jgi:3-oxoacyl-[acyl-carrier protein] reductase
VNVVVNGRDATVLDRAVDELRASARGSVRGVVGDVTTDDGRAGLLAACPEPDILINNSNGPRPGSFGDFDAEAWMTALSASMVSPLLLIRAVVPGMRERGFGRIINITSAMVTTPRPHMLLSSGPRAGLTAVAKGLSFEVARDNVTINNLLPYRLDTARQEFMAQRDVESNDVSYEDARARMMQSVAALRLGRPDEFGATCAFVCSEHAGYMSGMNIRVDGGTYPGLL